MKTLLDYTDKRSAEAKVQAQDLEPAQTTALDRLLLGKPIVATWTRPQRRLIAGHRPFKGDRRSKVTRFGSRLGCALSPTPAWVPPWACAASTRLRSGSRDGRMRLLFGSYGDDSGTSRRRYGPARDTSLGCVVEGRHMHCAADI
jgi:hypothetical protein